jgi:hypothetical protein
MVAGLLWDETVAIQMDVSPTLEMLTAKRHLLLRITICVENDVLQHLNIFDSDFTASATQVKAYLACFLR